MNVRLGTAGSSLSNVEHLAWRSLRTVVLLGLPELERGLRHYGLVQVEYQALVELDATPGGMRMGDLAAAMQVSASRLSHRMEKLTKSGLVTLEAVDGDARGTLAVITATGRALARRLATRHENDLRRVLFEPLQPQQVRALADALSTIATALGDAAALTRAEQETAPAHSSERRRWRDALRSRRP